MGYKTFEEARKECAKIGRPLTSVSWILDWSLEDPRAEERKQIYKKG